MVFSTVTSLDFEAVA